MIRRANAGSALLAALEAEPSWWAHVRATRDSTDQYATADARSKRYAARARRKPIRALMLACAGAPDRKHAVRSMCGLISAACTVPDEEAPRKSTYAVGDAFMLSVLRGAHELAKRGRPVSSPDLSADEDVRRVLDLAGPLILRAAERRAFYGSK